ncbi:MAG TPA: TonB family protein [Steroidobacteraceae bacterium]|nr:TonB family protein [Steroidobacteraceae bacterium]
MQTIKQHPFGPQAFSSPKKPRRPVAMVAAVVIQAGLIYLLAIGLNVVPNPVKDTQTVLIEVPELTDEPEPMKPVEQVKPQEVEPEIFVPIPEVVVDQQPPEEVVTAVATETPPPAEVPQQTVSVSEKVKVLNAPEPPYPNASILKQEEGTVFVRITVSNAGRVSAAAVEKSSGFTALDEAALKAIRTWRFSAAKSSGSAVESSVVVPVVYQLKNAK